MTVPPAPELTIAYESRRFVVIDKPSGLLSVPGKGPDKRDCVSERVRSLYPDAHGPITVHRLDMDTSGLIVCALDPETQRELSIQFERRHIGKKYTAVVDGTVAHESGTIDVPIRPDIDNRPYQIVDRTFGKPAQTTWQVMAYETDRTRLELTPLTGRTHQLRVHCAYGGAGGLRGERGHPSGIGHPIIGDVLYGPDEDTTDRLHLHAALLTLFDPDRHERVTIRSETPF